MKEVFRVVTSYFVPCEEGPLKPGRVSLAEKKELPMAQFGIKFGFPPIDPASLGVTERVLSVTKNNGDPVEETYPAEVAISNEHIFDLNDQVVVTLIDKDQSGNESPPSPPFQFTVTDDVPPSVPGAVSQAEKRQVS